jgi:hypothetical protein
MTLLQIESFRAMLSFVVSGQWTLANQWINCLVCLILSDYLISTVQTTSTCRLSLAKPLASP